MSEPLTPEQIDDYERHGYYPSFIATIRDREAALRHRDDHITSLRAQIERLTKECKVHCDAIQLVYQQVEAQGAETRDREAAIGQLWSYAENATREADVWCAYASDTCDEMEAQAERIKELEALLASWREAYAGDDTDWGGECNCNWHKPGRSTGGWLCPVHGQMF